ncbi:hypothetical protein M422DRAFT_262548 [Sphaerobolus stellatus SS14]|uniref:Uncharacterized protein n=1 Tax=Sphaerobolus stellatus (strain SS14) TaxID=990650 RepID=A0A0C9VCS5_SPHS4|nr:hypothetical protein M422DRAFT_262548 [Sphaerobolus stellatus SS14]
MQIAANRVNSTLKATHQAFPPIPNGADFLNTGVNLRPTFFACYHTLPPAYHLIIHISNAPSVDGSAPATNVHSSSVLALQSLILPISLHSAISALLVFVDPDLQNEGFLKQHGTQLGIGIATVVVALIAIIAALRRHNTGRHRGIPGLINTGAKYAQLQDQSDPWSGRHSYEDAHQYELTPTLQEHGQAHYRDPYVFDSNEEATPPLVVASPPFGSGLDGVHIPLPNFPPPSYYSESIRSGGG